MNLVPIDTGGAQAGPQGSTESSGGDFAALITGLMSGDTQIVPLLDLLAGDQLPKSEEASEEAGGVDTPLAGLEFIGMPPAGSMIPPPAQASTPSKLALVGDEITGPAPSTSETVHGDDAIDQASIPDLLVGGTVEGAVEGAVEGEAMLGAGAERLASVHPISSQTAVPDSSLPVEDSSPPDPSEGPAVGAPTDTPAVPLVADQGRTFRSHDESTPLEPTNGAAERVGPSPNGGVTAAPTESTADRTPLDAPVRPVAGFDRPAASARAELRSTTERRGEPTGSTQPPPTVSEVDVDTGVTTRPLETVRTAATVTPTAMVGIARRVEEAIAALATKPDPKIVTLQIDELDGLRLTVALRPDGLHLSSSGDAGLTTEIERALAARGFEMASDGREDGQRSEEDAGDGWRPQAPTRPSRRTTPSGIRL